MSLVLTSGGRRLPLLTNTARLACCQMMGLSQESSGSGTFNNYTEPTIPAYEDKVGEPVHVKRARLLYQSRKRGMLENDLILSGYASKFLSTMEEPQLSLYDRLINLPSNDWEIYYWATGVKETPQEFENEVMAQLKQYVRNEKKENRSRMPDLS